MRVTPENEAAARESTLLAQQERSVEAAATLWAVIVRESGLESLSDALHRLVTRIVRRG